MSDPTYERHEYDVLIIGAGGAGLRAAIEAKQRGLKVAVVTKSLLGKAHTVMAEGGIAAAMGNVYPEDNWMVHFRDTMRGGKYLNNYRMAELHAKEAPDRVWELEQWGALFDRTTDGKILQRDFGGHRYARLAHVGDRTGLELIRTLQQKVVSMGTDVFMECKVLRLVHDGEGRVAGCVGYWRATGEFVVFQAKAVILATGGAGKSWQYTTNSWESTGDGAAMALWAGAKLIDMEFVQFHPTGMVWPLSVRGLLVTEGVRGDGGVLRNAAGERFMFNYVAPMFRAETADSEEEADKWYEDHSAGRRPPELLPRDEVARAINTEVKAGRGSPHGGVFLDIASRRTPEYIRRRLPSMYHQFMELAGVDITREAMEIGPTCHYFMGGVQVDADSAATTVAGLFAAGEVAAGMHGANRLGGNSLSDLIVFGRRAGVGAAEYAASGDGRERLRRGRGGRGREGGPRPARAHGRREPLRHPARPPGDDAGQRRHYPQRHRARASDREARGVHSTREAHRREGRERLQPGLEPSDRPAEHDHVLQVLGAGGQPAQGVARRPHARGLPQPRPRAREGQLRPAQRGWPLGRSGHCRRVAAARDARRSEGAARGGDVMAEVEMRVWRGDANGGAFEDFVIELNEGEVVLDVIHRIQATAAPDLACRWNCKAGKCGSCSAEVNGRPRLMCMTRMDSLPEGTVTVTPMKTFPIIRDLVTDVSFNFVQAAKVPALLPPPMPEGGYRMFQEDVERGQEFRKCIECFLCQDVCHVIRDHEGNKEHYAGPRFFIRYAELEMNPLDLNDRRDLIREEMGLGYCNITKCCTEVCPEHIKITDNAIIPLKERVVDAHYDPLAWLGRKIRRKPKTSAADAAVQPAP